MNQEGFYRIALIQLPGIGHLYAKLLTEYFKGAKALFQASEKDLECIPGVGKVLLSTLCNSTLKRAALKRARQEFKFTQKHNIAIWFYDDEHYPEQLKSCNDSPYILYFKGTPFLNKNKILAVVGTRKATAYGEDVTRRIIEDLADHKIIIVSGLAYGIDAYAHKFSLDNNMSTIGVLAHGLDKLYPQKNRELARRMVQNGGLLTEFLSGSNPDRENFPKRNRIVAGMADATLIVEATKKGGALITANIAHSYGRDVLAVPGRSIDVFSAGCNQLIKSNKAALVESGEDVLKALNWIKTTNKNTVKQLTCFDNEVGDEKHILEIIQQTGISNKDQIALQLNQPIHKVSSMLFSLELNGKIKALPGNNYQLKA